MRIALGLAAAALLPASARADTLSVPSQHGTIQAAVDAAAPGDVIVVAAGEYAENVVVADAEALTIVADGAVTVAGTGSEPAILVSAHHTQLAGISVTSGGHGIVVRGAFGVSLRACVASECAGDGIRFEGEDEAAPDLDPHPEDRMRFHVGFLHRFVEDCVVTASGGDGFVVEGASLVSVDRLRVEDAGGHGVRIEGGGGSAIWSCTVSGSGGDGVRITRHGAVRVADTAVTRAHGVGIRVADCDDVLVWENFVLDPGSDAIAADGCTELDVWANTAEWTQAAAKRRRDRADAASGAGLVVRGSSAVIESNTVRRAPGGGLVVDGSPGASVHLNAVVACRGAGIAVGGEACSVRGNRVDRPRGDGLVAAGEGHVLEGNTVWFAGGDGIVVDAADSTVSGSTVVGGGGAGISVGRHASPARVVVGGNRVDRVRRAGISLRGADSARVADNEVTSSRANGIELLGASSCDLRGNLVRGSRHFDAYLDREARITAGANVWRRLPARLRRLLRAGG